MNNAEYLFKCEQCSANYLGETSRHLNKRLRHHKGISIRTGKQLLTPACNCLRYHFISCNRQILQLNMRILKNCKTVDLKSTYSVLIRILGPYINTGDCPLHLKILGQLPVFFFRSAVFSIYYYCVYRL